MCVRREDGDRENTTRVRSTRDCGGRRERDDRDRDDRDRDQRGGDQRGGDDRDRDHQDSHCQDRHDDDIEERALRTWVGGPDVMAGQLDRTLAVMSLPRVSLGIIPTMSRRHTFTQGSFWIFDDSLVQVEGSPPG